MAETPSSTDDAASSLPGSGSGIGASTADNYEAQHVHTVYEEIAPHFSATRFKPWPVVDRFLKELRPGSVGLDVGCGNGKYLTVNPDIYMIGSDRSSNLVRIAYERRVHDSFVADAFDLPHPYARFDFAISIAVIHHFSSPERRQAAISSILGTLRKPSTRAEQAGRALIFVWALEQNSSRRGWGEGDQQDVLVPWVLSKQYTTPKPRDGKLPEQAKNQEKSVAHRNQTETQKGIIYQRYYHLYRNGELERDISAAGGVVHDSGYEKDNWWAICGVSV